MRALLLVLLALVAFGCGPAEPVSASPDAAADAARPDVATVSEDAPEAPQDAAVDAAFDAAPDALLCAAGMTVCAASCVDVRSNPVHCGGCRRSCRSDESCVSGACVVVADAGRVVDASVRDAAPAPVDVAPVDVAPACVSMTPGNCCGIRCAWGPGVAEATCIAGRCGVVCVAGSGNCDGNPANGCESSLPTDPANCGACGAQCGVGMLCFGGRCMATCPAPLTACGPECTDTSTHRLNCGACGRACGDMQVCHEGMCVAACAAPRSFCGSRCVDLRADPSDCGACGTACSDSQFCDGAGRCAACPTPTDGQVIRRCGDACVELLSDDRNCGTCGTACTRGAFCFNGTCRR